MNEIQPEITGGEFWVGFVFFISKDPRRFPTQTQGFLLNYQQKNGAGAANFFNFQMRFFLLWGC